MTQTGTTNLNQSQPGRDGNVAPYYTFISPGLEPRFGIQFPDIHMMPLF